MIATIIKELTKNWIGSFTIGIKMSRLRHFTILSRLIPICGFKGTKCQSKLLVICSFKGMASNTKCTVSQMLMQIAIPLVLIHNRPDSGKKTSVLLQIELEELQGLTDHATIRNQYKAVLLR